MPQGKAPHTDQNEQHLLDSVGHLNKRKAHGVGSWEGVRVECGRKWKEQHGVELIEIHCMKFTNI